MLADLQSDVPSDLVVAKVPAELQSGWQSDLGVATCVAAASLVKPSDLPSHWRVVMWVAA